MFRTIITCLVLLGTAPVDALARGDEKKVEFEEKIRRSGYRTFELKPGGMEETPP